MNRGTRTELKAPMRRTRRPRRPGGGRRRERRRRGGGGCENDWELGRVSVEGSRRERREPSVQPRGRRDRSVRGGGAHAERGRPRRRGGGVSRKARRAGAGRAGHHRGDAARDAQLRAGRSRRMRAAIPPRQGARPRARRTSAKPRGARVAARGCGAAGEAGKAQRRWASRRDYSASTDFFFCATSYRDETMRKTTSRGHLYSRLIAHTYNTVISTFSRFRHFFAPPPRLSDVSSSRLRGARVPPALATRRRERACPLARRLSVSGRARGVARRGSARRRRARPKYSPGCERHREGHPTRAPRGEGGDHPRGAPRDQGQAGEAHARDVAFRAESAGPGRGVYQGCAAVRAALYYSDLGALSDPDVRCIALHLMLERGGARASARALGKLLLSPSCSPSKHNNPALATGVGLLPGRGRASELGSRCRAAAPRRTTRRRLLAAWLAPRWRRRRRSPRLCPRPRCSRSR